MDLNYIQNNVERRKSRSERKKTLCVKAHELVTRCGGEIFLQYIDENNKIWTYCSSDSLWEKYTKSGLQPVANTQRMNAQGKGQNMKSSTQNPLPTPTKTGPGDCNFVVTRSATVKKLDFVKAGPVLEPQKWNSNVNNDTKVQVNEEANKPINLDKNNASPEQETASVMNNSELTDMTELFCLEGQMVNILDVSTEQIHNAALEITGIVDGVIVSEDNSKAEAITVTTSKETTFIEVEENKSNQKPIIDTSNSNSYCLKTPTSTEKIKLTIINEETDKDIAVSSSVLPQERDEYRENGDEITPQVLNIPTHAEDSRSTEKTPEVYTVTEQTDITEIPKSCKRSDHAEEMNTSKMQSAENENAPQIKRRRTSKAASTFSRQEIKEKLKLAVSGKKGKQGKQLSEFCRVCQGAYIESKNNKKFGRWVGCENEEECQTWVHRKCIGWTENDVDSKKYFCKSCTPFNPDN